jgi:Ribosomal protein L14p/L23e
MSKRGRGGMQGNKFKMSLALPVAAVMNCADNSGAKNLYIVSVMGIKGVLNRYPAAGVGDMFVGTVKKGKPELRKRSKYSDRPKSPTTCVLFVCVCVVCVCPMICLYSY